MIQINKLRGVLLVILGIVWIVFVHRFDSIMGNPVNELGHFSFLGFALGILSIVNGIRIYNRKV